MRKICFLSMDSLENYVSDDELAIPFLNELGWQVETISWRDKLVDWNDFECVIIRTPWDYQQSPDEFLEVLRRIDASKARLENPLEIVEWNLSKLYLRELEANGIKIVPTIWDEKTADEANFQKWLSHFKTDEIIIKPIISATAEFTYRVQIFAPELTEIFANKPFMVQPFMPKIVSEGEFSLFYFGGIYSHTILKTPKPQDFRVQEEHGGIITQVAPGEKLLATAQKVFEFIKPTPLYARVDFVRDETDNFCVMELELIEPALYFRMDKDAPQRFARIFDKWMKSDVEKFWQNFCETSKINPETPNQIWFFGNSSAMAKELAELVISGKKTATASLAEINKKHPEFAPIAAGFSIVTDFEGRPLCVIQTSEIRHLPFDEVDAKFAFDEGEGDQSLRYWRKVHHDFFTREAAENGLEFNEKSLICCERFELLYPKK